MRDREIDMETWRTHSHYESASIGMEHYTVIALRLSALASAGHMRWRSRATLRRQSFAASPERQNVVTVGVAGPRWGPSFLEPDGLDL